MRNLTMVFTMLQSITHWQMHLGDWAAVTLRLTSVLEWPSVIPFPRCEAPMWQYAS
jgi:hypothetical protein